MINIKDAVRTKEGCEAFILEQVNSLYDNLMAGCSDGTLAKFVLPDYQKTIDYSEIFDGEDLYIEYKYAVADTGKCYKGCASIPLVYFDLDPAFLCAKVRNAIKYKEELSAIKGAKELLNSVGIDSFEKAQEFEANINK